MLANVNKDPKKGRAFVPSDFHPAALHRSGRAGSQPPLRADLSLLKSVFVDQRPGRASGDSK